MCKYCEQKKCTEDACNIKVIEKFDIELPTEDNKYLSINTYITNPTPISLKKKKGDYLAKMHIHYSCGYSTISMDIPVRFCPFCGQDLHELNK